MFRPYHFIATHAQFGLLCVYKNGHLQRSLKCGENSKNYSICGLSNGRIASSSKDGIILIWKWETDHPPELLKGHTRLVYRIIETYDHRLVSCSDDCTLRVWTETKEGWSSEVLKGHDGPILDVIQLFTGQLVSTDEDTLIVWTETNKGWIPQYLSCAHTYDHLMKFSQGRFMAYSKGARYVTMWTYYDRVWSATEFDTHYNIRNIFVFDGDLYIGTPNKIVTWSSPGELPTTRVITGSPIEIHYITMFLNGSLAAISCYGEIVMFRKDNHGTWQLSYQWDANWERTFDDAFVWGIDTNTCIVSNANYATIYTLQPQTWLNRIFKRAPKWKKTITFKSAGALSLLYSKQDLKDWHTFLNTFSYLPKDLWGIVKDY